ncbi:MAG TPA: HEAT repeat domain-containing protein [Solirubrobacteraceae bacterium]|jgi:HEAT repeat protein
MVGVDSRSPLAGALIAPSATPSLREQRRRAARLGVGGSDRDLPAVLAGLRSADRRVRVGSASALGRIATARAVAALVGNLRASGDAGVLVVSARKLMRLGEVCAVPTIESVLSERGDELDRTGRQTLVRALGAFAQRSSVPMLAARLADADGLTRKRAAKALARINYPESRRALELACTELSWWRSRWARRSLSRMCADLAR